LSEKISLFQFLQRAACVKTALATRVKGRLLWTEV